MIIVAGAILVLAILVVVGLVVASEDDGTG
jgi:hypothetical protein